MTGKQRFGAALRRERVPGRVPHFELAFFLTLEAVGKVHPSHRCYSQWHQMTVRERELQLADMADCYIRVAEKYSHDAIFIRPNPADTDSVIRLLQIIRERTGDAYSIMMHGDATYRIPNGGDMMAFSARLYEEPDKILSEQFARLDGLLEAAARIRRAGPLLGGFALCSDYCFNANPFYPSDVFEELIVPPLRKSIEEYRKLGYYTIKHSDGNIMPILEQIVRCGPDAVHSLDPQGGVDLREVKRLYGSRVALIGNVNCGLLQTGTDEEAAADVRRALREGMPGGGYVFSTSNTVFTGLPLERYELMHGIWLREGFST